MLPLRRDMAAAAIVAVATATALLLLAERLSRPDVPADVRDFTVGAGAAVAALMVLDVIVSLHRPGRRTVLALPAVLVVVGVVAISYQRLYDATAGPAASMAIWGAATMVAAAMAIGITKLVQRDRGARS